MTETTAAPPHPTMTAEKALAKVEAVDLAMIRSKLAHPEDGEPWPEGHLDAVERDYRRFLALQLMYPGEAIVPNRPVDAMWHAHILDTEAYARDCEAVFGQYLHHFPYFGLRGPEDAAALDAAGTLTSHLYEEHFGHAIVGVAAKCIRTSCKPQKCR